MAECYGPSGQSADYWNKVLCGFEAPHRQGRSKGGIITKMLRDENYKRTNTELVLTE